MGKCVCSDNSKPCFVFPFLFIAFVHNNNNLSTDDFTHHHSTPAHFPHFEIEPHSRRELQQVHYVSARCTNKQEKKKKEKNDENKSESIMRSLLRMFARW